MAEASILFKTYPGSEANATRKFQDDAAKMAAKGFYPTSQTYAPGSYGCASFILALLLCFILIGFLIFVYMLIVKPDGVLSVTYEKRSARGDANGSQGDEKVCPRCAEHVKAAARVCRFCGHEFG